MDKKISKQLRQFAQMLPAVYAPCNITISGEIILKENEEAKDAEGNSIKATAAYTVPAQIRQNHYRNLKKLYNAKGEQGCFEYAEMMREYVLGRQNMLVETVMGMAERKESITSGF